MGAETLKATVRFVRACGLKRSLLIGQDSLVGHGKERIGLTIDHGKIDGYRMLAISRCRVLKQCK